MTEMLGLLPLLEATGEPNFTAISALVEQSYHQWKDCIGYESDGESVMVSEQNSLWSWIKVVSPNCVHMKYICHSMALYIKEALENCLHTLVT